MTIECDGSIRNNYSNGINFNGAIIKNTIKHNLFL